MVAFLNSTTTSDLAFIILFLGCLKFPIRKKGKKMNAKECLKSSPLQYSIGQLETYSLISVVPSVSLPVCLIISFEEVAEVVLSDQVFEGNCRMEICDLIGYRWL
jgi:hypothetical protein